MTKKYPLSAVRRPSGLAIDAKNRRLFSVCSNRLMAISDPDAGKVVAMPAIGAGSDGVAFDPGTGYAFSSNGDGTLTIVRQTGGNGTSLENIATERGARTIAVDEKTHKFYLPMAKPAPAQPAADARHSCRTRSKCWWSANEDRRCDAVGSRRRLLLAGPAAGAQDAPAGSGLQLCVHPEAASAPPLVADPARRARARESRTTRSFSATVADAANRHERIARRRRRPLRRI